MELDMIPNHQNAKYIGKKMHLDSLDYARGVDNLNEYDIGQVY
jgi:hypothetical protein